MQQKLIRVAVIDGHRMFADALASRLTGEPDLEVVGTAATLDEALDLFSQNEIDVVVLDFGLAGSDGLALGRQLHALWPGLGIVVVTTDTDDPRGIEAVQYGVRGWVAMQSGVESLLTAIRGVARGEMHLPAILLTRVLVSMLERDERSTTERALIALLTGRELEVLRCLMDGQSHAEIAARLHIATSTVRTHINNILHKLSCHSALSAVALARRAGLVPFREAESA
ncbi:MAG: response regulator transcription factor [Actinomycetota bacterium]